MRMNARDELDEISKRYHLDKNISTNCHNYIPGYISLFKDVKHEIKNVLEIGIGSVENGQMGGILHLGYKTGNSLRCWRDYFVNANIYGIDIYPHDINETRIKVFCADQSNENDLKSAVNEINAPIDVIIDDGSHNGEHQKFSFMVLEKYLSRKGIYVIEDIQPDYIEKFQNLFIFPEKYREYIKNKYKIVYFDTRHVLNRIDDFMMAFITL